MLPEPGGKEMSTKLKMVAVAGFAVRVSSALWVDSFALHVA